MNTCMTMSQSSYDRLRNLIMRGPDNEQKAALMKKNWRSGVNISRAQAEYIKKLPRGNEYESYFDCNFRFEKDRKDDFTIVPV